MNVVVLTGAGISAESGIPTFRGHDGLWEGHRMEAVATPQAFEADPQLVHRFYNARRRHLLDTKVQPNEAHLSLAAFEQAHDGEFLLITQNIDDLHRRAGSREVLSMHDELLKVRCTKTGEVFEWREDLDTSTPHPRDPSLRGTLRPHVVWFGEVPLGIDRIELAAIHADVFIAIGTSGLVYPAAGIVAMTPSHCRRIEINLDATPKSDAFDESLRGPATELVPEVLRSL